MGKKTRSRRRYIPSLTAEVVADVEQLGLVIDEFISMLPEMQAHGRRLRQLQDKARRTLDDDALARRFRARRRPRGATHRLDEGCRSMGVPRGASLRSTTAQRPTAVMSAGPSLRPRLPAGLRRLLDDGFVQGPVEGLLAAHLHDVAHADTKLPGQLPERFERWISVASFEFTEKPERQYLVCRFLLCEAREPASLSDVGADAFGEAIKVHSASEGVGVLLLEPNKGMILLARAGGRCRCWMEEKQMQRAQGLVVAVVGVVLVVPLVLGCGGAQAPKDDVIGQRWRELYPRCKADPTPCRTACNAGEQVACAVLRDKQVAEANRATPAPESKDAGDVSDPAVVEIVPARLPKRPPAVTTRKASLVIQEAAALEDALKAAPPSAPVRKGLLGRAATAYAELALFSGPAEADPVRRAKLTRAGALNALSSWQAAVEAGTEADDASIYRLGLLWETIGKFDNAGSAYLRVVKEFPSSPLVPFAYLGVGIVLDAKGSAELAKKAFANCVDIPPWENPVWDEARKLAGLPEGYETPAMTERKKAVAEAETERRVADAFSDVRFVIDDIAKGRFKVRFGRKTFTPSRQNVRGLNLMEAELQRKLREDYCNARQSFIEQHGKDELAKRAKDHCEQTPPTTGGIGGGDEPLKEDCRAVVSAPCQPEGRQ